MTRQNALDGIFREIASKAKPSHVGVEIQRMRQIDKNHFVVAAKLDRDASEAEIASVFAERMEGGARLVAGSLMPLAKNPQPVVRFVAARNVVSRPFEADKYRIITAGVAADANDNIWRIDGEGDDRRVVQESADDLEALLNARRTRGAMATASMNLDVVPVTQGEYAAYLDTASGEVKHGFVFNRQDGKQIMIERASLEVIELAREAVLEAVRPVDLRASGLEPYETNANLGDERISKLIGYLRKAYPDNGTFLDHYESLMRQYTA